MKDFDRRIRQGGDDAIAALTEYVEMIEPKWIPVSERLPDERVDVLVSAAYDRDLPNCSYDAMHVCQRFEGDWVEATEYNRIEGVTHWMQLPPPAR